MVGYSSCLLLCVLLIISREGNGFTLSTPASVVVRSTAAALGGMLSPSPTALFLSDDFLDESAEDAQERIQALVEAHPVLLFMKGTKLFPQCGFSNNAVQILNSFGVEFHTVDVLSDQSIREGVKVSGGSLGNGAVQLYETIHIFPLSQVFSQWPTIPQLYIDGEFIGGSDIMIEMYKTGELSEMLEKMKADAA